MRITRYLYNAFLIESSDKKIAIDPGALFFYFFRFSPLIPESEWSGITHIFVIHGDPDHYWHTDRVAKQWHVALEKIIKAIMKTLMPSCLACIQSSYTENKHRCRQRRQGWSYEFYENEFAKKILARTL